MISKADVDGMAVEVEPSHQCSVTYCCHVTDSRNASEAEVWHLIPPCGKNDTHLHSLILVECLWTKEWE